MIKNRLSKPAKEQAKPLHKNLLLALIAVGLAWLALDLLKTEPAELRSKESSIGQKTSVRLPCKGSAQLNAVSALRLMDVPDPDGSWAAQLEGEAFFELKNDCQLRIETRYGMAIASKSSIFDIRDQSGAFEIRCFDGAVLIEKPEKLEIPAGFFARPDTARTLALRPFDRSKKPRPMWLDGIAEFEDEPLRNVLFELERQFDVRAKADPATASMRFSGRFQHGSLDRALNQIERQAPVFFEKKGQTVFCKLKK